MIRKSERNLITNVAGLAVGNAVVMARGLMAADCLARAITRGMSQAGTLGTGLCYLARFG